MKKLLIILCVLLLVFTSGCGKPVLENEKQQDEAVVQGNKVINESLPGEKTESVTAKETFNAPKERIEVQETASGKGVHVETTTQENQAPINELKLGRYKSSFGPETYCIIELKEGHQFYAKTNYSLTDGKNLDAFVEISGTYKFEAYEDINPDGSKVFPTAIMFYVNGEFYVESIWVDFDNSTFGDHWQTYFYID